MIGVGGFWVVLASASVGSTADGESVWALEGERDCDARLHLTVALLDGGLQVEEARQMARCDRTTALGHDVMSAFGAFQEAIEAHEHDPEALVVYAAAASTLRAGLLGDGVRMALQLEIAEALQGHAPGPWRTTLQAVAAAEPGPRPGEDPPAFRRMLFDGVAQGPDGDVVHWSRVAVVSAGYLAALPFVADWADEAQRAVDGPSPQADLQELRDRWRASWVPEWGIVSVTLDLLENEAELHTRWDALLNDV